MVADWPRMPKPAPVTAILRHLVGSRPGYTVREIGRLVPGGMLTDVLRRASLGLCGTGDLREDN